MLRLDLEDFFAAVTARRVYGIFREAGYPEPVAYVLTALSTNVVPHRVWASAPRPRDPALLHGHHRLGRRLATPHLPQGSPVSPALANLAAFRLDVRLHRLAEKLGATYGRYADDLVFSGDLRAPALVRLVERITREEGFALRIDKTTTARRHASQRVAGLVVNVSAGVSRAERKLLEAILTNTIRHGHESQNRAGVPDFRAHLAGRIAWIGASAPDRAAKLRALFDRIAWS